MTTAIMSKTMASHLFLGSPSKKKKRKRKIHFSRAVASLLMVLPFFSWFHSLGLVTGMPHLFIVCCRGVVRIQEKAARTTTTRGLKRRSREFASLIPNLRAAANWMEQSRRDAGGAGRGGQENQPFLSNVAWNAMAMNSSARVSDWGRRRIKGKKRRRRERKSLKSSR